MSESMIYVIGGLAGLACFLVFVGFRAVYEMSTQRLRTRLKGIENGDAIVLRRQRPNGWRSRLDQSFESLIMRTGLDMRADQATGWMLLVGCVLAIGAYFLREDLWFAGIGFAIGAGGVLVSFFVYRASYLHKLQDQLADTIYLLARSLRAGMSLEQGLQLIGDQGPQPLAAEFKRCHQQIKLGLPITIALENLAAELQMIDFNALVSTIAVFQTTGGNLPMLLDRLAASARDRALLRTHFRTATALARVSVIPIGLAVPLIIFAYLVWQPDYVTGYLETITGRLMMGGAVVVECLGIYWIYRLLKFDY